VVLAVLLGAALYGLHGIHAFGQERFFTVDEFQTGHATWLVSQGHKPYVDFYEHHFPGSYALHALFLPDEGSFPQRALALRSIVFAYLLLLSGTLAVCVYATTRSLPVALLSAFLPLSFGFSAMSQIDYRADNFAACLFLSCLALLDANRVWRRRGVALLAGVFAGLALLMTQKAVFLAGGSLAILAARDLRGRTPGSPWLSHPLAVFAPIAVIAVLALLAAGVSGMLPAAYQATILDAFRHEAAYPEESSSLGQYVFPFLRATWPTTLPILAFASYFLASPERGFWWVPLVVAVAAGALAVAQYPYNYVFLCFVLVLCAVRGFALALDRLGERLPRVEAVAPLLLLLPLATVPNQLGFLDRASSNEQQMNMLRKIEAYTDAGDVVIDNAGGALFRDHASYYWYHGDAHQKMFADYFAENLARDYRRAKGLFWIIDFRMGKLPASVRRFWRSHYVVADSWLYTLGFVSPATGDEALPWDIDVLRAGDYHVHPARKPHLRRAGLDFPAAPAGGGGLDIDGRVVRQGTVRLEEGRRVITVLPHSPPRLLSLIPPDGFDQQYFGDRLYTPLFEYADR
jgi:MFS family permease